MTTARSIVILICSVLMVTTFCSRLVNLEADLPKIIRDYSAALWVDEGYKTLSPRNIVEFGQPKWNSEDTYRGWMSQSIVTQSAFLAAFKVLGVDITHARLVTIGCFAILIVAYLVTFFRLYGATLLMFGGTALSGSFLLFVFSRTAIFEMFLVTIFCVSLFLVRRIDPRPGLRSLIILVSVAAVAIFGVKASASLYFAPAVVGLAAAWIAGGTLRITPSVLLGTMALVFFAVAGAWATEHIWAERIGMFASIFAKRLGDADIPSTLKNALENPLIINGAVIMSAGMYCAGYLVIMRQNVVLESSYLSALVAVIFLGPLVVGTFNYNPLRYWIPLLPASFLVCLEAVHLASWDHPRTALRPHWVAGTLLTGLGTVALGCALYWLGASLTRGWLIDTTEMVPSVSRNILFLISSVLAGVLLWRRRRLLARFVTASIAIAVIISAGIVDFVRIARFLREPIYDRLQVARRIMCTLPPGSTVAGDWAPVLTIGTRVPALYLGGSGNSVEHISRLQPSFLIASQTPFDQDTLAQLRARSDVKVGAPELLGNYAGHIIMAYPLAYHEAPSETSQPVALPSYSRESVGCTEEPSRLR